MSLLCHLLFLVLSSCSVPTVQPSVKLCYVPKKQSHKILAFCSTIIPFKQNKTYHIIEKKCGIPHNEAGVLEIKLGKEGRDPGSQQVTFGKQWSTPKGISAR